MLFYASLSLIGIAVFIIANTMFTDESKFKASEKLGDNVSKDKIASLGIILRYSRPFFQRYFVPIVQSMKGRNKIKTKYKRPLAGAGLTDLVTPEEFYSFKLFLIIGFPIMFLFLRMFLEEDWALTIMMPLSLFGYFYPDFWFKW